MSESTGQSPHPSVELTVSLDARVNLAMQQNDVPIIKELRLHNRGTSPLVDAVLQITPEPAFSHTRQLKIAEIAAGGDYRLGPVDLSLSPDFLLGIQERISGYLEFSLTTTTELANKRVPLELLAYNEWSGLRGLPEILAAFVMPNDPALGRLLKATASILQEWTGDSALCGYQRNSPKHVGTMVAALYEALRRQHFTYINPPASFEQVGQKIRLPAQLLDAGMGTCLDLAVLAAGCLEQLGLHPFVVLTEGHAFTAVWLIEQTFPLAAVYEVTSLRKRIELGEILAFDPTCCTNEQISSFETPVNTAKRHLQDTATFHCAIDIRRARMSRIRPLPLRTMADQQDTSEQTSEPGGPALPPELALADVQDPYFPAIIDAREAQANTPQGRLAAWQGKLLDLTLRNRLLNFKETKQTLPILCPDLATLEDRLAEGKDYQILPKPAEFGARQARNAAIHEERTGDDPLEILLREQLAARRLHTPLTPKELEDRLVQLHRSARTSLEESGVSGLYLALGFLRWHESEASDLPRYAPILLIPVSLVRTTVRSGFRLERSDDDPRLNTTLMELLLRDYGVEIPELDELPEDDAGLDVPKIMHIMKRAIRDEPRWEVEETSAIGIFMFTKFMMWADLRDRVAELMTNAVVSHLVNSPEMPFEPSTTFPHAEDLDRTYQPVDTFCPVDADSSQLAAVFAAAEGRSFVLQGPPGTGKSQTITNLIAHCLSTGHSVLFVSEKMAALNVVRRRLDRIGLGPFCLELHSNKANKKEVLRQFKEVLDYGRRKEPAQWEQEANSLANLRHELNDYVDALHKPHRNGLTAYTAIDQLIGLRDAPLVALHWDSTEAHSSADLEALKDLVQQLALVAHEIEPVPRHPWRAIDQADWSINWQRSIEQRLDDTIDALTALQAALSLALDTLRLEVPLHIETTVREFILLCSHLIDCPNLPAGLFAATGWDTRMADIDDWLAKGQEAAALRQKLSTRFNVDTLLELQAGSLQTQWQQHQLAWGPLRWWRQRPILALLQTTLNGPGDLTAEDVPETLRDAKRLQALLAELATATPVARETFAAQWKGIDSDWEHLASLRDRADAIRTVTRGLANGDDALRARLLEHWALQLPEAADRFASSLPGGQSLQACLAAWKQWEDCWTPLTAALELDETRLDRTGDTWLARIQYHLERWNDSIDSLRDWCTWQDLRRQAIDVGLSPLIDSVETGDLLAEKVELGFTRGYLDWWYSQVNEENPPLRKFSRLVHANRIQKFRELDTRFMETTRQMIIARLAAKLPANIIDAHPNSELGRINREIQKRSRHIPIRQLLHQCQSVVPALKPCFLMSPLSVAQYLSPDHPRFDLVVFDEASQIPVWDAIGAIGRGQRVIVVGDPKQLPPTSFFSRIEEDGASTDDYVEDMESILDECLAAGLTKLELGWHYRSQHEALIAFSNYHYYDNHLLTFPAAASLDLGVHLVPVPEGTYDKGKSRTNRAEADRIVAMIVGWLTDPDKREFSIGVVTFSQPQQTLIEDLLEEARANTPEIEYAFADDIAEPVFVKNLENVQGDERDIILFSVCYGPDDQGRISMNFGPLNQNGGERRLNVAITRARRAVHLVSTLRADQIDLARTQALGVRHLKSFLEYADRGPSVLGATNQVTGGGSDSPLEAEIANALRERGWALHQQVGCSGYRIDLAILDPRTPGNYLLGIECDGATYHRSKAARDRDKIRQSVLENLGWRIHRIWSTDWWLNPQREIELLESVLADPLLGSETRAHATGANAMSASHTPSAPPVEPERTSLPHPDEILNCYDAYNAPPEGNEAEFDTTATDNQLQRTIRAIAELECPIAHDVLLRRVADAWQISRLTRKRRERLESLLVHTGLQRIDNDGSTFYWLPDQKPAAYHDFRVHPEDDPYTRDIEDIPLEEVGNACKYILANQGGLPAEDLARVAAQLFNCKRVTARAQERLFAAFALLMGNDDIH